MTRADRRLGFTLIELLVVVSIIAILASLLLPSLQSARMRARCTLCLSNQKQFPVAIMQYVDDSDHWWPMAGYDISGTWNGPNWSGIVAHYGGFTYYTEYGGNKYYPECKYVSAYSSYRNGLDGYILKCPNDNDVKNPWGGDSAVSYGWNTGFYGLGSNYGFDVKDYYVNQHPIYTKAYGRVRTSEIYTPQTTLMTGDFLNPNGPTVRYEYMIYQLHSTTYLGYWDRGGLNVVWVDGHATWEDEGSLNVDENGDNRLDYWHREQ